VRAEPDVLHPDHHGNGRQGGLGFLPQHARVAVGRLSQGDRAERGGQDRSDAVVRDFFDIDMRAQDRNRAAFVDLWKYIASRYKDNPWVMFGVMNEPLCLVDIPDQAAASRLSRSYSLFMERISDAIRSVGASQPIVVDFPFLFDSQGSYILNPINRDGIVWEVHPYVSPLWGVQTVDAWKAQIDGYVHRIVDEFRQPFSIPNPFSAGSFLRGTT
jgi:hypothetical protein